MQTIAQTRANNLSQLMDELIAGVATFRRTTAGPDGRDVATTDSGRLEGTPTTIRVTFADDIGVPTVQAIINAHVPGRSVAQQREDRTAQDRVDFEVAVAALPAGAPAKLPLVDLVDYLRGILP